MLKQRTSVLERHCLRGNKKNKKIAWSYVVFYSDNPKKPKICLKLFFPKWIKLGKYQCVFGHSKGAMSRCDIETM